MSTSKIIYGFLISVIFYFIVYIIISSLKLTGNDYMLQGVGSVFSAFAFIGIAYNLFIQSDRLTEERKKTEILIQENEERRNTDRLSLHLELFNNMKNTEFSEDEFNLYGINLVKLRKEYHEIFNYNKNVRKIIDDLTNINETFDTIFSIHISKVRKYVEVLVNIMKHIDKKMKDETKQFWYGHLKLIVTPEDIFLLHYYCIKYNVHKDIFKTCDFIIGFQAGCLVDSGHKDYLRVD